MINEENREYFQRRAEQELTLAQKADVPAVVAAHYKLAEKYLDRVDRADPDPSEGREPDSETGSETLDRSREQPDERRMRPLNLKPDSDNG